MALIASLVPSPYSMCDWDTRYEQSWPCAWPVGTCGDQSLRQESHGFGGMGFVDLQPIIDSVSPKLGFKASPNSTALFKYANPHDTSRSTKHPNRVAQPDKVKQADSISHELQLLQEPCDVSMLGQADEYAFLTQEFRCKPCSKNFATRRALLRHQRDSQKHKKILTALPSETQNSGWTFAAANTTLSDTVLTSPPERPSPGRTECCTASIEPDHARARYPTQQEPSDPPTPLFFMCDWAPGASSVGHSAQGKGRAWRDGLCDNQSTSSQNDSAIDLSWDVEMEKDKATNWRKTSPSACNHDVPKNHSRNSDLNTGSHNLSTAISFPNEKPPVNRNALETFKNTVFSVMSQAEKDAKETYQLSDSYLFEVDDFHMNVWQHLLDLDTAFYATDRIPTVISRPVGSFSDILFSSITSSPTGVTYEPWDVCDLCREPLEIGDDHALSVHLARHLHDFGKLFKCDVCKVAFVHKGDLDWHLHFAGMIDHFRESKSGCILDGHFPPGVDDDNRSESCYKLLEWEQAQLKSHNQHVYDIRRANTSRQVRRASSLPPNSRIPLAYSTTPCTGESCAHDSVSEPRPELSFQAAFSMPKMGESDEPLKTKMYDLQRRILEMMDKVQPKSPSTTDRGTPYSDFCDSHSLPGSPEQVTKDVPALNRASLRAKSEPPSQPVNWADISVRRTAPYAGRSDAYGVASRGMSAFGTSPGGEKRRQGDRHSRDQSEEDGADEGSPQKKRKVGGPSGSDESKKYPCICYVGEPQQYGGDLAKHKHISNLCRHLKSHDFYVCSTCIQYFSNDEDLDRHFGCHIKACRKKGCKRTRPAWNSEQENCPHVMTAEDQWREMFILRYRREPPNVFKSTNVGSSGVIEAREESSFTRSDPVGEITFGYDNEQTGMSALNQSFEPSLTMSSSNEGAPMFTPQFDIDEFLMPGVANDSSELGSLGTTSSPVTKSKQPASSKNVQLEVPMTDIVSSLQQQVTTLEKLMSTKTSEEKDYLCNLQAKVAQLEQKLFQSSERERQLEATLGVVFDAYQATGAPQAQPNKALWNLVMSHSSQAISSATGCSGQVNDGQVITSKSLDMTPPSAHPVSTPITRKRVHAYPDSAYGSMQ